MEMTKRKVYERRLVPRNYWTPMSLIDEMERTFEDFRTGMRGFWFPSTSVAGSRIPAIDMKDAGNEYIVEADMPGMSKENVEIEIVEGGLRISAKKEEASEEEREGYLRRERGYMSFHRRLPIPEDSDVDAIEARLVDGVLQITIPKKERPEKERKTVEVK